MYFCKGYDCGKKVDLFKGYWNPKRKMWVATHFSPLFTPSSILIDRSLNRADYQSRNITRRLKKEKKNGEDYIYCSFALAY